MIIKSIATALASYVYKPCLNQKSKTSEHDFYWILFYFKTHSIILLFKSCLYLRFKKNDTSYFCCKIVALWIWFKLIVNGITFLWIKSAIPIYSGELTGSIHVLYVACLTVNVDFITKTNSYPKHIQCSLMYPLT